MRKRREMGWSFMVVVAGIWLPAGWVHAAFVIDVTTTGIMTNGVDELCILSGDDGKRYYCTNHDGVAAEITALPVEVYADDGDDIVVVRADGDHGCQCNCQMPGGVDPLPYDYGGSVVEVYGQDDDDLVRGGAAVGGAQHRSYGGKENDDLVGTAGSNIVQGDENEDVVIHYGTGDLYGNSGDDCVSARMGTFGTCDCGGHVFGDRFENTGCTNCETGWNCSHAECPDI